MPGVASFAKKRPPIPSTKARTEDAKQQEKNLEFVAVTRTMQDLYFVHED